MEQKIAIGEEDGGKSFYFIKALKNSDHQNVLENFSCSNKSLDNFIINEALGKHDRKESGTFLVVSGDRIFAYFTISFVKHSIEFKNDEPRDFSFLSLDYIAVETNSQNKKIGTAILEILKLEAKSLTSKLSCVRGIILVPIDENAKRFYMKNDFTETKVRIKSLEDSDYFWIDSLNEEE